MCPNSEPQAASGWVLVYFGMVPLALHQGLNRSFVEVDMEIFQESWDSSDLVLAVEGIDGRSLVVAVAVVGLAASHLSLVSDHIRLTGIA